jgi:hypothetical protein
MHHNDEKYQIQKYFVIVIVFVFDLLEKERERESLFVCKLMLIVVDIRKIQSCSMFSITSGIH